MKPKRIMYIRKKTYIDQLEEIQEKQQRINAISQQTLKQKQNKYTDASDTETIAHFV